MSYFAFEKLLYSTFFQNKLQIMVWNIIEGNEQICLRRTDLDIWKILKNIEYWITSCKFIECSINAKLQKLFETELHEC
jgi:hypothetical protein